jgi:CRISPR/Cas system-associated exonuclease Cas4 (RecB family)
MDSIKETLVKFLTDDDKGRSRSTQVNVGPSEIGGCARRLWYRINEVEPTNHDTLRLSAIMGTAIHTLIESVFADRDDFLTETEVEWDGIKGHIDLIDTSTSTIWDWKTTTKSGLGYFPSKQQIEQVQIYGYLATQNDYPIETVGLVAIPRDGNENDIVEWSAPYDEQVALAAIERYLDIRADFVPPPPEKEASFCQKYCPFFGTCEGIVEASNDKLIENLETIELITSYKDLQELSKGIKAQLDFAKEALEGTTGVTPDGTIIKWSSVAGRQTIDEAAVAEALGFVPKKQGEGYSRLTIK